MDREWPERNVNLNLISELMDFNFKTDSIISKSPLTQTESVERPPQYLTNSLDFPNY